MNVLANIAIFAAEKGPGVEAHHPMYPEAKELIYGVPAFLIIFGLLMWKAVPAMKKALAARSQRIQQSFDDAAARKADAIARANHLNSGIGSAEDDAAKIIADAKEQAVKLKTAIELQTTEEIAAHRERHMSELTATTNSAELDLRSSLGDRAIAAAAKVVANLDDNTQQRLIDASIAEVAR
jgi:F-type H+-transporting ATPase subunit b